MWFQRTHETSRVVGLQHGGQHGRRSNGRQQQMSVRRRRAIRHPPSAL